MEETAADAEDEAGEEGEAVAEDAYASNSWLRQKPRWCKARQLNANRHVERHACNLAS
jgi:hypothetical protein